jgi:peptide-methionine (S)-S-oxide reductase
MSQGNVDRLFAEAVTAMDAGDENRLERILAEHPNLVAERLEEPGSWLRDKVSGALDGFFSRPYLLWFVAEDPVRNGTLPKNIAEMARIIVATAKRQRVSSLQEQLDYALLLVAWSGVAAELGVQSDLIDVLIEAGASPDGTPDNALVNGHVEAARHLVARGAPLTLTTALCLERWSDVDRLIEAAKPGEVQFAFVMSALNGRADALRYLLSRGASVDRPSANLYAHGTPLHHAVCSGSLEAVRVLVEAGANRSLRDSAHHGTALDWADYYESGSSGERKTRYAAIVEYLRARE